MPELAIISADSHSNEPEEIYDRLPAEYRTRAPHEEVIDGKRYLVYDGQSPSAMEAPHPLNEDDMRRYWRDGEALGRGAAPRGRHTYSNTAGRPRGRRGGS